MSTQRAIERRFTAQPTSRVSLESREDAPPEIHGYAAVFYDGSERTQFELWPGVVERIMPGAFDQAVQEDDVRGLFNHDPDHLLGRKAANTLTLEPDKTGLRYAIEPGETQVARDVTEHIRRGDLTGSSFAFTTTTERWVKEDGVEVRKILGVRLYDVGPVTFPAYESTTAGVRSSGAVDEARASYDAWRGQSGQAAAQRVAVRTRVAEIESSP